jgi:hypothetical protein
MARKTFVRSRNPAVGYTILDTNRCLQMKNHEKGLHVLTCPAFFHDINQLHMLFVMSPVNEAARARKLGSLERIICSALLYYYIACCQWLTNDKTCCFFQTDARSNLLIRESVLLLESIMTHGFCGWTQVAMGLLSLGRHLHIRICDRLSEIVVAAEIFRVSTAWNALYNLYLLKIRSAILQIFKRRLKTRLFCRALSMLTAILLCVLGCDSRRPLIYCKLIL